MPQAAARPPTPTRWDSDLVEAAFADAMGTLAALPMSGHSGRLATLRLITAPGDEPSAPADQRPWRPRPTAAAISAMDKTMALLSLLPNDRPVLRKLILLRAQLSVTGRPMSWARIGREVGASPLAVRGWHETAIAIILRALNARRIPVPGARDGR